MTLAPRDARKRLSARPMPPVPPTIATFVPVRSRRDGSTRCHVTLLSLFMTITAPLREASIADDPQQPTRGSREGIMKRHVAAGLVLAVVAGVGWKLASHPETSTGLQEVSLSQHSEHAQPGPANALAGIRIRLSGSDFKPTDQSVPQIAVTTE